MDILDKPIKIGGAEIPARLFLAPMAGITDMPMRVICARNGCKMAYSEMVSAKGLKHNKKSAKLLSISDEEICTGVQLFGSDPEVMADMAKFICDNYKDRITLIDINMGCPAKKIVKCGEGAALLKSTLLAARIIETVVKVSTLPVTVKCRKGWDDKDISREMAQIATQSGASALTLHGRTAAQGYSGKADWGSIKRAKEASGIPVIGNGDIKSTQEALNMLEETGCDAVMVARAAVGNPWIFADKIPEPEDRLNTAMEHLKLEVEYRGEKFAVPFMRKNMSAYIKGMPGAAHARVLINSAKTAYDMEQALLLAFRP